MPEYRETRERCEVLARPCHDALIFPGHRGHRRCSRVLLPSIVPSEVCPPVQQHPTDLRSSPWSHLVIVLLFARLIGVIVLGNRGPFRKPTSQCSRWVSARTTTTLAHYRAQSLSKHLVRALGRHYLPSTRSSELTQADSTDRKTVRKSHPRPLDVPPPIRALSVAAERTATAFQSLDLCQVRDSL